MRSSAGMFASFTRNAATMMSQLLEKKESGDLTPSGDAPAESAPAEPAAAAEEE